MAEVNDHWSVLSTRMVALTAQAKYSSSLDSHTYYTPHALFKISQSYLALRLHDCLPVRRCDHIEFKLAFVSTRCIKLAGSAREGISGHCLNQ